MSNIRTLNDVRRDEEAAQNRRFQGQGVSMGGAPSSNQSEEPFKHALEQCFPSFSVKTVTFIFSCIITVVFFTTAIVGALLPTTDPTCLLYRLGSRFTYSIFFKFHIHRLVTPVLLHLNFFHLFWNVLGLFWIGF